MYGLRAERVEEGEEIKIRIDTKRGFEDGYLPRIQREGN